MNNDLQYKKATIDDLSLLTKSRMKALKAANKLPEDTDVSYVEGECREHYIKSLQSGEHTAYLAFHKGEFAGCGGISYYSIMPTYHNPTGKCAYIMNMFTEPNCRGMGIATAIVKLLLKDAQSKGYSKITLEATDMGRPVYEKIGFVAVLNEMEYPSK